LAVAEAVQLGARREHLCEPRHIVVEHQREVAIHRGEREVRSNIAIQTLNAGAPLPLVHLK
jgi:hypothetical protein